MFNFFRRRKGSTENLVDIPDKMLDEDFRFPDENQNTDTDCIIEEEGDRVGALSLPESAQSQPVQARKGCKKVRWAEEMEQVHEDSDNSTQVSSSEDEADEQTPEEEDEEEDSQEEDEEESSKDDDEDEDDEDEDEEDDEEVNQQNDLKPSIHMEELNQLKYQLGQMDRDVTAKTALIDRLQTELKDAYQEAELAKFNMSNLQHELEETQQNLEQAQNHESETESVDEAERAQREEKLKEAEKRICQLEEQLRQVIKEKEELEDGLNQIKSDRDREINEIQKAYDEALKEQDEMIAKFEEDFEELRTLNSRREQQLLDDFEWKLREVEKNCKTRVEKRDKDKDREIAELVCQLADANLQLQELKKFELCKAELEQVKSSNTELKRNLRTTNRRFEEVQVNEKVLQEETSRLRSQLDKEKSFVANLQIVHREELDERERKMNFRLESQKNLLNTEWEDRLKREARQLKLDLELRAREETNSAVEQIRQQGNKTVASLKSQHEEKTSQLSAQMDELKKRLSERDVDYKEALENVQSRSDTDMVEMRRKMEKLYMSYEEKIEKLNEQHEQQLSRVQEECEKRIQQIESNLQMHSGTSRTTVELVKEQFHRENQSRLQQLENQHQRQLEEQWSRMNRDKEDALRAQDNRHKELMKQIQHEMEQLKNYSSSFRQKDKLDKGQIKDLCQTVSDSSSLQIAAPSQLQIPVTSDRSTAQQSMRAELGEAEANLVREKERLADLTLKAKMCQTIQQLTLQLEASKKEVELLNSKLRSRNNSITPTESEISVSLPQEPPAPPPRSRGRQNAVNATSLMVAINDISNAQTKETHTIPTAKVQPQNFVKEPQPTAKVRPQSPEPVKPDQQPENDIKCTPVVKVQPQVNERPAPPGVKVQPTPNQQLNQQSYNQSRRSRKHRSRRH